MLKKLIESSPWLVRKPIKIIYSYIPEYIKLGKIFRDKYNFLEKSQYWPKEQLEEYQMIQLKRLISYSYNTVPYYNNLFNEYNIKPRDIQNFNDLKRIPYLTKQIIQNNLKDLVSKDYDKRKISYVTTGGSTGIPMGFYEDKVTSSSVENAFMFQQWKRVGFDVKNINRNAILRGNTPSHGIYEKVGNNLVLSSYHLTDENMRIYIKLLEDYNPNFIQAYPSSIYILSDYIVSNNITLKVPDLKSILCGSENLYDFQRDKIEKAFKVRVFSWYGHTEKCCLAGECEKSNYYHLFSEYGYTELIDENGNDVTEENKIGELVVTGFNNYAMPFIRYRTMDLAENTNEICSCGRNYKLIKRIEGRLQELLLTSTGRYISMTAINMHSAVFDNVMQFQFYQDTPGLCILYIIKKPAYDLNDEKYIYKELMKKLGADMKLEIKYVDKIEKTKLGKYRFLIQKLKINYSDN